MEEISKIIGRHRLSSEPINESWTENDNLTYEPMERQQSEISTSILRPFRDTCQKCLNGFFVHFFITCKCKATYCCSCVALIHECTSCKEFLGKECSFTKTKLFNNRISMHKCIFQKEEENCMYSPSLKTLLYTDSVTNYKEISSLLDIFTENKLNEENSNYVFHTILRKLNLIDEKLLIHYDVLFKDCLYKTQNKMKINMNFISNITKITNYKNTTVFGKNIDIFLQEGKINSDKKKKTVSRTKRYSEKILCLKFLFTIVVTTTFLSVFHLFKM
jgi:hypothetical protein